MLQLAKHVHAKFQLSSFYLDGLSQVNFRIFSTKNQNFPILRKIQIEHGKRRLSPKFQPYSIFTKISKLILKFLTPEFALEISKFQNTEYEVHQSSPTDEG
jgi:hypothetical protein